VLIKIYRPNANLQFPNGGKLTPFLEKLNVGDKLHVEGPFGKFAYEEGGNITLGRCFTIQEKRKSNTKGSFSWQAAAESLLAIRS
jgi:hypothetical protein